MSKPHRPIPDDFSLYASIEGNLRLRKRYNARGDVIERWRKELGLPKSSRGMRRDVVVKSMTKGALASAKHRATKKIRFSVPDEKIEDLCGWEYYDPRSAIPWSSSWHIGLKDD